MGGDRNDQGTGQGVVKEDFLSENIWRAIILTSAAAVILFSVYCLTHGITIIFMHLYYFPIVLLAYRYRYRGFVLAQLLALAYVVLVVTFHPEQAEATGAFYRFAVFIGIAAVVAYLSERLAAAHTSQKEALDTIRELQQFQESVITNANVWITVLAPDGTIIVWNDAAEAISGYKRGDVLGKRTIWRDLYPDKAYWQEVTPEIQRVIGRDTYLENFETEIRCADGTQKTNVWTTRGIRDPTGTIQSYIAIGRDITEQKRAEEALRETNEYLRNLLDYANAPIIVWDPNFRITRFNHAFERLTGRIEREVIGQHLVILFPEASREDSLEQIKKTLAGERWETVEIPILHVSGETRIVLWNSANIVGPQGTIISTIAQGQDITERKKMSDQIEASLNEKETLLREIHHRVRNNLQVASSIINFQAKSVSDPASLKQMREIRMRIGTLALVHEIAYLAKTPESINMRDFLYRCTSRVIDEFGCEPGRIDITITAENVQVVLNQAVPCSLIVNELLMNSIRHAFPGNRRGEIRIGFSIAKGNYVLEYSDDGVGFPEGMHPEEAETGGLSLIQGLARQIRGTVESRTRPGTRYTLTFPAEIREEVNVWQK